MNRPVILISTILLALCGCQRTEQAMSREQKPATAPGKITARVFNSGFADAHDTYNGMGAGSDGKIYYVLCSEKPNVAGQVFRYDPAADKVEPLGDLNDASGEKEAKTIAQGKSHVTFVESDGRLYFATHIGFYSIIDDMEKMGIPPAGMKPYPGGHFLSLDMKTGGFEKLATAPRGEGILTMNMDTRRKRLYALTWPTGYFITYDLNTKQLKDLGPTAEKGENGKGKDYRTICRSFAIDPRDGSVYYTRGEGSIHRYDYNKETIETYQGEDLKKDYFGLYDPTSPGHMGYNWRQTFWLEAENRAYGVHGNSGYLFRFDPQLRRVEVLHRLTSMPSKLSGMYDQFSYGYLGFALGPDGQTIHYLTGGPVYVDGKRVKGKDSTGKGEAKGVEDLHLVTYHIPSGKYADNGAVFYPNGDRPSYVNSIAIGKDGTVYTIARIYEGGKMRADLVSFPGPLKK